MIGAGATIMTDMRVGKDVIVAPGSVVMNNIPARTAVSGTPAKVVGENIRAAAELQRRSNASGRCAYSVSSLR